MDGGLELSFVCFARLLVFLFACSRVCVCVRLRIRHYAGIRSSTLAVGLVLRNAADALQLSNMMRSLPQSVVRRNLLIPISLFLWPGYPLIASGTLDGILGMDGNYVSA